MRVPNDRVDALAPGAPKAAFRGQPGWVWPDTSTCLHFGARVAEGTDDRLMVQFQYLTPAAFGLVGRRVPGEGHVVAERCPRAQDDGHLADDAQVGQHAVDRGCHGNGDAPGGLCP
jgi:hypothetical protein